MQATHGTWTEFVSIADVNGDGSADLLFAANNDDYTTGNKGYFVYQDPGHGWMPTRRIWNQETYHITNVRSDGKLPAHEVNSWSSGGFNNYRVSAEGKATGAAPDLVPSVSARLDGCPTSLKLAVTVQNTGTLGVLAGTSFEVFLGPPADGNLLVQSSLPDSLLPGQSETLLIDVDPPSGGQADYFVVVDPDKNLAECNAGNNTAVVKAVTCGKF